jgi:hypothetical protein
MPANASCCAAWLRCRFAETIVTHNSSATDVQATCCAAESIAGGSNSADRSSCCWRFFTLYRLKWVQLALNGNCNSIGNCCWQRAAGLAKHLQKHAGNDRYMLPSRNALLLRLPLTM